MIKQVQIKEFKVIKDFDESFENNIILLKGDNGVGKSSVIQFIEIALGKQKNIPPQATGEGIVIADFRGNQYTFQVTFKDNKPVVTITTPDGMKDNRKSTLASIVGAIDFDIDVFAEQSKSKSGRKEQIEVYKKFLDPEVIKEIERLEANITINCEQRTFLNRDVENIKGAIEKHPLKGEKLDDFKPVDISTVYEKLSKDNEHNSNVERIREGVLTKTKEATDIETEINRLMLKAESLKTDILKGEKWLQDNPVRDVSQFEAQINNASEINLKAKEAGELLQLQNNYTKLVNEAGELTALIESSRQAVQDAIRDMDSPITGLSFDAEQLLYNGIPVNPDSLSKSEIMELGVKLKIAENPGLGVLFIQEGESIGAKRLEEIKSIADKNGFQIIMEQVERGNENLTIELIGSHEPTKTATATA